MSAAFVELGVMGQWCHRPEDRREACSCMQRRSWWRGGGEVDEKSERTTNGRVGSFDLRGVNSIVEVDIRRRGLQTLDHSKTRDFNHHDLVDNIAIFTTLAFVCYCSRDLSNGRTFSTVKVWHAHAWYLVVHLTD